MLVLIKTLTGRFVKMNNEYREIVNSVSSIKLDGPINSFVIMNALNNQDRKALDDIITTINSDMSYFDEEGDMKESAIEVLGLVGEALSILNSEKNNE